jgi:hypothetical protein
MIVFIKNRIRQEAMVINTTPETIKEVWMTQAPHAFDDPCDDCTHWIGKMKINH